nr:gamma carbonic anhydrase family protein [Bacteroidales bacterium]
MSLIKTVRGFTPIFGNNCFFVENSTIVGDVIAGDDCSFWFNSVIRGDVNSIRIGNKVNIQDGAILHCSLNKSTIHLGNNVSIGHNAVIHGANIGDNVLVGMGSIIMDNVEIEKNSIIAAGSLILENTVIESGSIYGGVPAKKIRSMDQNQIKKI